jgi:hypothetical protein
MDPLLNRSGHCTVKNRQGCSEFSTNPWQCTGYCSGDGCDATKDSKAVPAVGAAGQSKGYCNLNKEELENGVNYFEWKHGGFRCSIGGFCVTDKDCRPNETNNLCVHNTCVGNYGSGGTCRNSGGVSSEKLSLDAFCNTADGRCKCTTNSDCPQPDLCDPETNLCSAPKDTSFINDNNDPHDEYGLCILGNHALRLWCEQPISRCLPQPDGTFSASCTTTSGGKQNMPGVTNVEPFIYNDQTGLCHMSHGYCQNFGNDYNLGHRGYMDKMFGHLQSDPEELSKWYNGDFYDKTVHQEDGFVEYGLGKTPMCESDSQCQKKWDGRYRLPALELVHEPGKPWLTSPRFNYTVGKGYGGKENGNQEMGLYGLGEAYTCRQSGFWESGPDKATNIPISYCHGPGSDCCEGQNGMFGEECGETQEILENWVLGGKTLYRMFFTTLTSYGVATNCGATAGHDKGNSAFSNKGCTELESGQKMCKNIHCTYPNGAECPTNYVCTPSSTPPPHGRITTGRCQPTDAAGPDAPTVPNARLKKFLQNEWNMFNGDEEFELYDSNSNSGIEVLTWPAASIRKQIINSEIFWLHLERKFPNHVLKDDMRNMWMFINDVKNGHITFVKRWR